MFYIFTVVLVERMDGFHVKGHFYLGGAMVRWQRAQIQDLSFCCLLTLFGPPRVDQRRHPF